MRILKPIEVERILSVNECLILDVRERYEWEICQIPALRIPMAEVWNSRNELPADQLIVVMCRTGKRAEAIAHLLEDDGKMKNIAIMEGGMLAWIEQVDPTLETY